MAKWNPPHGKPLVCIHWLDAHGTASTAYTEETIPHKAYPMHTYGLLMRDDESGVSVCSENYFDDVDQIMNYRGHSFIPRGMVVSVEVLLSPTRHRKKPQPAEPSESQTHTPPH